MCHVTESRNIFFSLNIYKLLVLPNLQSILSFFTITFCVNFDLFVADFVEINITKPTIISLISNTYITCNANWLLTQAWVSNVRFSFVIRLIFAQVVEVLGLLLNTSLLVFHHARIIFKPRFC
jgi:hypothetical protein